MDVAASVLSRLPHHGNGAAFVDAVTGRTLSFLALRQGALSLASGLRLGLGFQRGDAVLVLSRNSLLLPQILLGILAAGGVVVTADPDATSAEIAAAAHGSGAVMIVAEPEADVAGVGVPLLLTSSRSPLSLSAEELIDGGDLTAEDDDLAAFLSSSAASRTVADLVAAVRVPGLDEGEGRRVCLASLPMCSAHGLALIALGLPAAGVTTVLRPHPAGAPSSSLWEAVATHAATDVVAAPEALAGGGPVPLDVSSKLSSLRRVMVAPTPLTPEARHQFRRRLPWVQLMELGPPMSLGGDAAVIHHNSQPAEQMSAAKEATSMVPPLSEIQKIILGDISSRSTTSKHPVTGSNRQAFSKM